MAHINKKISLLNISLSAILLFAMNSTIVFAKSEFEFEPSISASLGYSDNLQQSSSVTHAGFISEISPVLKISREGSRVKTNLDYKLKSYFYSNNVMNTTISENTSHDLQSNLFAELVENSIFLDVDASISQESLDISNTDSSNPNTGINNNTETATYGIKPYWEKRWGNLLTSTLSYEINQMNFDADEPNNSDQRVKRIYLKSGKFFNELSWKIDLTDKKTSYDLSGETRSTILDIDLKYAINKQFAIRLPLTHEKIDEGSSVKKGMIKGLGLVWTPSINTQLDFTLKDYYYADKATPVLKFNYNSEKLGFSMSYEESTSNTRGEIRNNNLGLQESLFADQTPVEKVSVPDDQSDENTIDNEEQINETANINEQGILIPLNTDNPNANSLYGLQQSYVSRRFTADVTYTLKKSDFKLGYYQSQSDGSGKSNGIDFSWDLKLGKRMNALSSVNWANTETSDDWKYEFSLKRRLSRELSGNLTLSHQNKTSENKSQEFRENTLFLNLNKTFR